MGVAMKLTKHDIEQINRLAAALSRVGQVVELGGMMRLSRRDKEEAVRIKEWGKMARSGLGLGYGRCTLDDGKRDGSLADLSPDEFDAVHAAVLSLPSLNQAVIASIYRDEFTAQETGIRLGRAESSIDLFRDEGLSILYGALCSRISA